MSQIAGRALAAALVILFAGSPARAAEPPLFAAFKTLCIDTGAVPEAVEAAVKAAGGKVSHPPASTDYPIPMSDSFWNVPVGGHKLAVSAGWLRDPRPDGGDSETCEIESFRDENASLAKVREWVGTPAEQNEADTSSTQYLAFQQNGAKRTEAPSDDAAYMRLKRRGLIWQLTVSHQPGVVNFQLMHFLPAGRHHD